MLAAQNQRLAIAQTITRIGCPAASSAGRVLGRIGAALVGIEVMAIDFDFFILAGETGQVRGHDLSVGSVGPGQRTTSNVIFPSAIPFGGGRRGGVGLVILIHSIELSAAATPNNEPALDSAVDIVGTHWCDCKAGTLNLLEHKGEGAEIRRHRNQVARSIRRVSDQHGVVRGNGSMVGSPKVVCAKGVTPGRRGGTLPQNVAEVGAEGEHPFPFRSGGAIGDINPTEIRTGWTIIDTNPARGIEGQRRAVGRDDAGAGMLDADLEGAWGDAKVCDNQATGEDVGGVPARQLQGIGDGAAAGNYLN